ncbi:MAG: hypothetical protein AB8B87_07265 [Granulosicoccus sp.]
MKYANRQMLNAIEEQQESMLSESVMRCDSLLLRPYFLGRMPV